MGRKRSKKGKTAKNNPNNAETEPEELSRAPHSFVIHRGSVGRTIVDYTKDFRKVMEPFTASSLKVRKKNVLKDFAAVAGLLHVSHLVMFTSTETASYVRFGRFPRGPTLTFRMLKYSLSREVLSQLRKQYAFDKAFRNFPLVVLNNFSGEGAHMKLMATMFQNMFPTINLTKVNLDSVRRCVLFNYNHEDKTVEFRHYGIRVAPVGLSRGVKKLIQSKVPNLSRYEDVSEFLLKGEVSESEAEDDGESHVTLPQKISSRGNVQDGQSAIRLSELGPRMTLQLIKVEGGLCEGEVIYHDLIKKTPKEISLINKRREQKRKLKEERKRIQEKNIERKQRENLSKKEKKTVKFAEDSNVPQVENDNDSEWYRKEVGQDPDKELFNSYKSSGIKRKYPYKGSSDTKNKVSKPDFNQVGRKRPYNSSSDEKSKRSKPDFNQGGRKYPYKDSSDRKGQRSKPDFSQGGNRRAKQFQPKSFKNKKVLGSKVRKGQRHR